MATPVQFWTGLSRQEFKAHNFVEFKIKELAGQVRLLNFEQTCKRSSLPVPNQAQAAPSGGKWTSCGVPVRAALSAAACTASCCLRSASASSHEISLAESCRETSEPVGIATIWTLTTTPGTISAAASPALP